MTYVIIEMQTNGNSTAALVSSFTDLNEAEQKYHQVLSYAAVSPVENHACMMVTDSGDLLKKENYPHAPQPQVVESSSET